MQLATWLAKQTGKLSDRFNDYKFYVKQQPQHIDSSSVVSLQTFDSRDMTATIPCSFKWFTVRNGLTTEIHQFRGNTFICEPADVGCMLQVEITSSDPECTGTAVLTYGPVVFDVLLKKQIEMALSAGEAAFVVDVGDSNNTVRECHLRVEEQRLLISHIPSQTVFTVDYNIIEPRIQVSPKIPTRVRVIFSPRSFQDLQKFLSRIFVYHIPLQHISHNPFIDFHFPTRKARDSFVFITKAFNTKKQLISTSYVTNLQKQLDFTKFSQKQKQKSFDYLQQISHLHRDISKLLQINTKTQLQKRTYIQENKRLQKEIEEIVSTYVKIIEEKFMGREDFERSFVVLKEKEGEVKGRVDCQRKKEVEEWGARVRGLEGRVKQVEGENVGLKGENGRLREESKGLMERLREKENGSNTNSPFKRKTIFQGSQASLSPSSNPHIINQQDLLQNSITKQQHQQLKHQLQQMTLRYIQIQTQLQKVKGMKGLAVDNGVNGMKRQSFVEMPKDNMSVVRSDHQQSTSNPHISQPPLTLQHYMQQNTLLKQQITHLTTQLQALTSQSLSKQTRYKKRISDLTQQLQMYKRNNDVLNRSQHLSMEMEEYNEEQLEMLKRDNVMLRREVEGLRAKGEKYMIEAKKYRQLKKDMKLQESVVLLDQEKDDHEGKRLVEG